ncbi:hypothetical protein ACF1AJ_11475 [Leifsonia sp. NPDC014704]|uniref:hypothetical protein n=1 Tax=Leifsonia sp. NPDC014704 TaxID=3364123 RepID=UPI0036F476CF
MNLLLTLLGVLGLVAVTLLGIVGSGLLAAKRMAEMNEPPSKPDPTGRKTKS